MVLITTIVEDVGSKNRLEVKLPISFYKVRELFEGRFGIFKAESEWEEELCCHGLISDIRQDETTYSFYDANKIIEGVLFAANGGREHVLAGALEMLSYQELSRYYCYQFYESREDYIYGLCDEIDGECDEVFGVRMSDLLDYEKLFKAAQAKNDFIEASNGTLILKVLD